MINILTGTKGGQYKIIDIICNEYNELFSNYPQVCVHQA
jgi:hypothetical protein